jgi:hypothetical protein
MEPDPVRPTRRFRLRAMRIALGVLAAAFAASVEGGQCVAKSGPNTAALVELYTSEGCSSCPPADRWLSSLSAQGYVPERVVPLALHVDYWDYIGWKDAFATRATTQRQRNYARVLKQRYVYTPEMVVEGIGHDTGRERAGIERLLAEAQRRTTRRATPELSRTQDGALTVKLAAFPLEGGPADVTLAIYDRRHSTPVASGENQGRMLENFNIVRRLQVLSRWDGAAASWTVDDAGLQPGLGAAVLVQRADHGPVIGCNKLEPMVSG